MTMTHMMAAGIDVGKSQLDLAIHGQTIGLTAGNDAKGWRRIGAALEEAGVGLVGIEATGGYERGVVEHLRRDGIRVLVLQPAQVRAFAKAGLWMAKNDRIDAGLIAAFTALVGSSPKAERGVGDLRLSPLSDLLVFIEQAEEDIKRAKTRLEHIRDPRLRRLTQSDVRRAQTRRRRELARLEMLVRRHGDLALKLDLLLSIPGIGARTALTLVVAMPELGQLTREQAAALAGLCPYDRDSGARTGERHIAGGRDRVRTALYSAAVPASTRWNPTLMAFYNRLKANGKTPKQAFIACARKLIIFANTVLSRQQQWMPVKP